MGTWSHEWNHEFVNRPREIIAMFVSRLKKLHSFLVRHTKKQILSICWGMKTRNSEIGPENILKFDNRSRRKSNDMKFVNLSQEKIREVLQLYAELNRDILQSIAGKKCKICPSVSWKKIMNFIGWLQENIVKFFSQSQNHKIINLVFLCFYQN